MPPLRLVVVGSAEDANTELWLEGDLLGVTVRYDGRLHLRVLPRPDGEPWLLELTSLSLALESAARRVGEY
jgi:hypothetical protein